ncbi:MAG: DUF6090 family protein [Cyclobacteriaceae bacterium]
MLFLLRKIRRKLLKKTQIATYLPYAIGEIVLVVAGILIAVQIESNYSALKERREELVLLAEMKNNLNQDLIDIDSNIDGISNIINGHAQLLAHLDNYTPLTDSLEKAYFRLSAGVFFANNTSAYKALSSTGLTSISSDSLRRDITTLYDLHYPTIQKIEGFIQPFYIKLADFGLHNMLADMNAKRSKPKNLASIYKDDYLKELLKLQVGALNQQSSTYAYIREAVVDLIRNLDREIKRQ